VNREGRRIVVGDEAATDDPDVHRAGAGAGPDGDLASERCCSCIVREVYRRTRRPDGDASRSALPGQASGYSIDASDSARRAAPSRATSSSGG
jgi:hypothetical protein